MLPFTLFSGLNHHLDVALCDLLCHSQVLQNSGVLHDVVDGEIQAQLILIEPGEYIEAGPVCIPKGDMAMYGCTYPEEVRRGCTVSWRHECSGGTTLEVTGITTRVELRDLKISAHGDASVSTSLGGKVTVHGCDLIGDAAGVLEVQILTLTNPPTVTPTLSLPRP